MTRNILEYINLTFSKKRSQHIFHTKNIINEPQIKLFNGDVVQTGRTHG